MTEHTPTPWEATDGYIIHDGRYQFCCGRGHTECCGNPDMAGEIIDVAQASEQDARHIVHCVNSHDALVKALEELTKMYVRLVTSGDCGFWNPEEEPQVIAARAALAAAKEEKEG